MTIRELAKLIGVSPATISIVINGKKGVSEDMRKKVLDALKTYQYNPPARKSKSGKDVLLVKYYKSGMLVEEKQGFISMIIDSMEEQLRGEQIGMTMTVVKTGLKSALETIDYSKYCGLFLIATEVMREDFARILEQKPALTTIHVQRNIMGKQSVIQLLQLIEDPRFTPMKTQITGGLVARASVRNLME